MGVTNTGSTPTPMAVSQPISALVAGPLRPATVLAALSAAVVLCCDVDGPGDTVFPADEHPFADEHPSGQEPSTAHDDIPRASPARIVTVLTREASGVPNGARTALESAAQPFAHLGTGDAAFVGAGTIRLPGLILRAVRTIRTSVPRIAVTAEAVRQIAEAAARASRGVPDDPAIELRSALGSGDATRLRQAVRALVGLGRGSTPGGDDVLCGALAGLRATGRDVLAQQIAAAALPDIASRTTLMSADLMRLAAAGHVCTEAHAVLCATAARPHAPVAGRSSAGYGAAGYSSAGYGAAGYSSTGYSAAGRTSPVRRGRKSVMGTAIDAAIGTPIDTAADTTLERALDRLLAVGHTSGADLATGIAIGLGAPPSPPPRQPRAHRGHAAAGSAPS